ncbi:S24 family peptidase [Mesorhizobium sp. Z1-4]|uniref:XRE family transcriptional regulator n=1 Tax=Mesorhizobium sp. Z1-4 TaxID=2448478 RepID=UPI000FD88B00|nr:S24 family peptidase [Mesorhizobium sp. Z1-4]
MIESASFVIVAAMSTKGARIKEVRDKLQLTQEGFARLLGGITRGAVGNWERDQGIKEENLELISARTGISYEWLATGRGSMDPNDIVQPAAKSASSGSVRIPDLNIFGGLGGGGALAIVQGNDGLPLDPDDLRGYWTFPEYLVRAFGSLSGIYAWEVRGDSMEPTLAGGSVVFVDTRQNKLPPNDIYAIDYGDGLMVKRLKLVPRSDLVSVISDNDRYAPDNLPRDDVQVFGRVIGWFQWRG